MIRARILIFENLMPKWKFTFVVQIAVQERNFHDYN